jgi:hypothetical protein
MKEHDIVPSVMDILCIWPTEVNKMSREERVIHWRTVVHKQAASGLSAAAFCREQQINPQRFYHWRRRFHEKPFNVMPKGFVELLPCAERSHSGVRIRTQEKLCIEVMRGFDPHTLRSVIEVLGCK